MDNQTPNGGVVGVVGSLDDLLTEIRNWFGSYVKVTNETDLDILALWTIHTYLCQELYYTPRLLIDSPAPGSGKTTLLEHLNKLCFNPILAASVSNAVLARVTAVGIATLLLDEADRTLNPQRPGVNDLLQVINGGYKKDAVRIVSSKTKGDNWTFEKLPTFSPVALAGNTPLIPADTRSRCIVIRLLPDKSGTIKPSEWRYLDKDALALAAKIQVTADNYREQFAELDVRNLLPAGCVNRMSERWSPLRAIAELASVDWANRVNELIERDIDAERELAENPDIQAAPAQQLMKDLYSVFQDGTETLTTHQVVVLLIKENPGYWSSENTKGKELTPQGLGRTLTAVYGIQAQRLNGTQRGYYRSQFESVWQAFGITPYKPTTPTKPTESDLF